MKIKIDLEFDDEKEVAVMDQLIATFRAIAGEVGLTVRSSSSASHSQLQRQESNLQQNESLQPGPSIPSTPRAVSQIDRGQNDMQPLGADLQVKSVKADKIFNKYAALLARIKDCLDNAVQKAAAVAMLTSEVGKENPHEKEAAKNFVNAFQDLLWDAPMSAEPSSIVPFCEIVAELPKSFRDQVLGILARNVMIHLQISRKVDCKRSEMFHQAETFAALVSMRFLDLNASLNQINEMLQKSTTQVAALNMLGKTLELCSSQVEAERLEVVADLYASLDGILMPHLFEYDLHYIREYLPFSAPPAENGSISGVEDVAEALAAEVEGDPLLFLQQEKKWKVGYSGRPGKKDSVKALAVDVARSQVVSITSLGLLLLHNLEGHLLKRIEHPDLTFLGMEADPVAAVVAVAAQPEAADEPPQLLTFQLEEGQLHRLGTASLGSRGSTLLYLRFLTNSFKLAVGEASAVGEPQGTRSYQIHIVETEEIGCADGGSVSPLKTIQTDHVQITALAAMATSEKALLSGDKQGFVVLWDVEAASAVAKLLPPPAAADRKNSQQEVLLCLEHVGALVFGGTLGQGINIWDLRALRGAQTKEILPCKSVVLDGGAVTRMLRGPGKTQLAVATVKGITHLALDADGNLEGKVVGKKVSESFYFDMKWSAATSELLAANQDAHIDVYSALPPRS